MTAKTPYWLTEDERPDELLEKTDANSEGWHFAGHIS